MKKLVLVLLSIISVICVASMFSGCGEDEIEVRGQYYTMEQACENGWFSEEDIKSIACAYYDYGFGYEENPYYGMFTSTEELSERTEKELKLAYPEFLDQRFGVSGIAVDDVNIYKCYGIYNKNVVISIGARGVFIDPAPPEDEDFGGVIFKNFYGYRFIIYHTD